MSLTTLARRAAQGKRRSPQVARFLLDVDRHTRQLHDELSRGTYAPGPGRRFLIQDPKPRCIFALPFRDRVVQHLLIDQTLPAVERSLAPQTYACRQGLGTHRCLRRAAQLFRRYPHLLCIDVQKFFPSIDHAILRRLLDPTTPLRWRWLRDRFLDAPAAVERVAYHFPGDDLFTPLLRRHGLPVGSLTSQIWANVYLSPLDHLLASGLGIGTFVRYGDDMLIFDRDEKRLHEALAALQERACALRLRLHPTKTRLFHTDDQVPFLGFVFQRRGAGVHIRLRHDNVVRMRRRVRRLRALFAAGALDLDDITARIRAWLAHARHGHTRALLDRELSRWSFVRDDA